MEGVKSIFASRTVWGVVVSITAQLLAQYGYEISDDLQGKMVELILQVVSISGAGMAIVGRVKATKQVKLTTKDINYKAGV